MILAIITSTPPPQPDIWHDTNALTLISIGVVITGIVIGAIIAIWAAVYQVRKQRPHRKITYQVVPNVPVAAMNYKVLKNGKPVSSACLTILKIQNTGDVSIREQDYFEALAFEFPDTEIVDVDMYETKPTDLINPSRFTTYAKAIDNGASKPYRLGTHPPKSTSPKPFFTVRPHTVELPNFPLNPGEFISFTVALIGKSSIQRRGRLNQGEIVESSLDNPRSSLLLSIITFLAPFFLGALFGPLIVVIIWVATGMPLWAFVPLTILALGLLPILPMLRLSRASAPKIKIWSIGKRQLVAMLVGIIIYGVIYYRLTVISYSSALFNPIIPSIGGTFNDYFVLDTILYSLVATIPLFFAVEFGPWVGLVSIEVATLIIDYFTIPPLFSLFPWYWYLSDAIFVFIPGLALLATQGRYNTTKAIAIAVGFSTVGIVISNIVRAIGDGITSQSSLTDYLGEFFGFSLSNVACLILLPILLLIYEATTKNTKFA